MPLSKTRQSLLDALSERGGSLEATQLTVPARRLATRMQRDGLVTWTGASSRHACVGQILHITDAGRTALGSSPAA